MYKPGACRKKFELGAAVAIIALSTPAFAVSILRIVSINSPNGSDITVGFDIVTGQSYRLERSISITDPSWASISGVDDFTANTNGIGQITDPGVLTLNLGHAFYRVDLLERLTAVSKGTSGTVRSNPAGIECDSSCSANFIYGTSVTLNTSAHGDSKFAGWSGDCTGTGDCTVTMDGAKSVTATFSLAYSLTISKTGTGAGNITSSPSGINCGTACAATFFSGTMVTLTPTADTGSAFNGWSGACTGTGACTVTMDAAKSVSADFLLLDTNPACATYTDMGTVAGDGSTPDLAVQDVGEKWLLLHIKQTGNSGPLAPLTANIQLTSPSGANYDLYVYCFNCGGTLSGSATGTSSPEIVNVRHNSALFGDSSYDVLIEIRYVSGNSPGSWILLADGNIVANFPETCASPTPTPAPAGESPQVNTGQR